MIHESRYFLSTINSTTNCPNDLHINLNLCDFSSTSRVCGTRDHKATDIWPVSTVFN